MTDEQLWQHLLVVIVRKFPGGVTLTKGEMDQAEGTSIVLEQTEQGVTLTPVVEKAKDA